jgi:Berberine and berberine like
LASRPGKRGLGLRRSIAPDAFSVGINLNLTGDEPPERTQTAFAADGYDRLRAIKRTYDPDDLFGPNQTPLRNQAKASETGAAAR